MVRILKALVILLFLALIIGTGQQLVIRGRYQFLWYFFWFGLVVWLWGYGILMRVKDRAKTEEASEKITDPIIFEQQAQLDRLKIAAVSALVAITFFYSSISWIFKDNFILSIIVLVVTFLVSFNIQNMLFKKDGEKEE